MAATDLKSLIPDEKLKILRVPTQYQKVYKDECVFSFTNPFHKDGVYVNLKTYMGVAKQYLALDQSRCNKFPIYLHQHWDRKLKPKTSVEGAKVTKFAVGVEGGFTLPGDKFDIVKTNAIVVVSPEGEEKGRFKYGSEEEKKGLPEILVKVVESILSRTDGTESKDVFSLEEEVKESKHARNLVQLDNNKKISNNPKDWKCEDSGLTKNIWLNLSTGYIGSGRKETGGTEAAVRHWEETGRKYPLVVKLGTITPEKADVYSYGENAMVLDPLLDKHLAHWGLDRSKLYQTDKDMTQINIDAQSKAFMASVITGEGEKQEAVSGVGLQPLTNFGNACYINSTYQLLFAIKPFMDRYAKHAQDVFKRAPSDPAADFTTQMCKLALTLQTTDFQGETSDNKELKKTADLPELSDPSKEVRLKMLKMAGAKDNMDFKGGRQQDAQEFILHVLKIISRDARAFQHTPGCKDLSTLFEFALEERTEDTQSKQVAYKVQKGSSFLTLPIPEAKTASGDGQPPAEKKSKIESKESQDKQPLPVVPLEDCLKAYLSPSTLEGYTSPVTEKKGIALRNTRLRTFPEFLFIQMFRFEQVDLRAQGKGFKIQKIRRNVPMPENLDLKSLRSTGIVSGEKKLPERKRQKPTAKPEIVQAVQGMGFSENAGIRAALATSNAGQQQAVEWVLAHMQDADLNDPVTGGDEDDDDDMDPGKITQVSGMGFPKAHAIKALKATKGDVARAIEWLFARAGQLDNEVATPGASKKINPGPNTDNSKYKLVGFISHIGDNTASGHYVAHVKKDNKWVLFNDSKVTACENPPFGFGYIYLYRRA